MRLPGNRTLVPRVAAWAVLARVQARRAIWTDGGATPVRLPRAPADPSVAARVTVDRVLVHTRAKCLVRSLVLQEWFAAQGEPVDVIIGVTAPSEGFRAHAWLDREDEVGTEGFTELHRIAPAAAR